MVSKLNLPEAGYLSMKLSNFNEMRKIISIPTKMF